MLPNQNNSSLIQIQNLSKHYNIGKQSIAVLKDINLSIHQGEFLSIIGPSGSGKSTLLHLLGGLDQPSHGCIIIDEQNIGKLSDQAKSTFRNQKIGFVFQDFHLLENLTVEENIGLPLMIRSGKNNLTPAEQTKVKQIIKELDLSHRAKHRPSEISGGQKQRVAIGRALVNDPEIILADEPTGNLDAETAHQIINLLKKIHQEKHITLIIITHDEHIAKSADHIIQIQDGQIIKRISSGKYTH